MRQYGQLVSDLETAGLLFSLRGLSSERGTRTRAESRRESDTIVSDTFRTALELHLLSGGISLPARRLAASTTQLISLV